MTPWAKTFIKFQKTNYPEETAAEESKRIEEAIKEGEWGASGTAVEQTIEIPIIPKTKKGLKFDAVSKELKIISDDFFKLRNHNPQYKSAMQEIKDEIRQASEFEKEELFDPQQIAALIDKSKEETAETLKKIALLKEMIPLIEQDSALYEQQQLSHQLLLIF